MFYQQPPSTSYLQTEVQPPFITQNIKEQGSWLVNIIFSFPLCLQTTKTISELLKCNTSATFYITYGDK